MNNIPLSGYITVYLSDFEAETPIFWPLDAKNWLTGKDPDAGKDWRQEEKGTTEDEMVGWLHRPDGRESEWTLGVGDGQGGLACCGSWVAESDTTEWLRVFSNESTLHMRWPKYWSFSFSISPSSEHPGLISFRMDWLNLTFLVTFKYAIQ